MLSKSDVRMVSSIYGPFCTRMRKEIPEFSVNVSEMGSIDLNHQVNRDLLLVLSFLQLHRYPVGEVLFSRFEPDVCILDRGSFVSFIRCLGVPKFTTFYIAFIDMF